MPAQELDTQMPTGIHTHTYTDMQTDADTTSVQEPITQVHAVFYQIIHAMEL